MTTVQEECIKLAAAIQPGDTLPEIHASRGCPECARLYMAWVGEANAEERATVKGQYMQHLRTCEHALARWQR